MAEHPAGEKTEQPSPRKRERAREEGQIARSPDFASAVALAFSLVGLMAVGSSMLSGVGRIMIACFGASRSVEFDASTVSAMSIAIAGRTAMIVVPIALITGAAGVAANVLQGGFNLSWRSIAPKWERIDPVAGLGRVFSLRALASLLVMIIKVAAALGCGYLALRSEWGALAGLVGAPPGAVLARVVALATRMSLWVTGAFLVAGSIDYAYKHWSFEKALRMTKQEAKEDLKEQEGDPHLKARVRSIQQQMARRRMMREVPKADVVITNPTHVAVAIRYDSAEMTAPKVVAKGKRLIAKRIKAIAAESGVPIIEKPPLARALEKSVPIGAEIPERLYRAVAEVLGHLYRHNTTMRKGVLASVPHAGGVIG